MQRDVAAPRAPMRSCRGEGLPVLRPAQRQKDKISQCMCQNRGHMQAQANIWGEQKGTTRVMLVSLIDVTIGATSIEL